MSSFFKWYFFVRFFIFSLSHLGPCNRPSIAFSGTTSLRSQCKRTRCRKRAREGLWLIFGGVLFEIRPEHHLYRLTFVIFRNISRKIPGHSLAVYHDRFPLHHCTLLLTNHLRIRHRVLLVRTTLQGR
jgi:hypothetical protein